MTEETYKPTPPPVPRTPARKASAADITATLLSWLLVPMFMPVYGTMMILGLSILDTSPFHTKVIMTLVVTAVNVVLPMSLIYLMKLLGLVSDVALNNRRERTAPYMVMMACMAVTGWYMYAKGAPMWMSMFYFGGVAAGLVNFAINFFWKISAHAAGIAGVVAIIIRMAHDGMPQHNLLPWLVVWIILSGMLGSARIWLSRHTPMQVLAGFATGFTGVFLMTLIG